MAKFDMPKHCRACGESPAQIDRLRLLEIGQTGRYIVLCESCWGEVRAAASRNLQVRDILETLERTGFRTPVHHVKPPVRAWSGKGGTSR